MQKRLILLAVETSGPEGNSDLHVELLTNVLKGIQVVGLVKVDVHNVEVWGVQDEA